ncbi:hypothetical protein SODG_002357 [Sodalis praecaptivus]
MSSGPSSYKIFDVTLKERYAITPSLQRCVFYGEDVTAMARNAPDQRIKVVLPLASGESPALEDNGEWYPSWPALPAERRPPLHTYTLRNVRPEQGEVDIEFVMHGDNGPASRWVSQARAGDRLQLIAPNAAFNGHSGGFEWLPLTRCARCCWSPMKPRCPRRWGYWNPWLNCRRHRRCRRF